MDFDTSSLAIEVYKIIYDGCFDNLNFMDCNRPYLTINSAFGKKLKNEIELSGDIDFNFKEGFAHNRVQSHKHALLNLEVDKEIKNKFINNLSICENLRNSCINVSLLPKTGSLNNLKQGVGNDRFDTFIYVLDMYYNCENELIFNHSTNNNMQIIKDFMDGFGDVYDYCEKMYRISNGGSGLIDELLISGRRALLKDTDSIAFMTLAYKCWRQRLKYINTQIETKKLKISNELSNDLARVEKELDKWY